MMHFRLGRWTIDPSKPLSAKDLARLRSSGVYVDMIGKSEPRDLPTMGLGPVATPAGPPVVLPPPPSPIVVDEVPEESEGADPVDVATPLDEMTTSQLRAAAKGVLASKDQRLPKAQLREALREAGYTPKELP
jgi:hypothetical protein